MVQNVSNQQPQKPSRGKVFLNALGQTAMTAGIGAAGGAGISALASVVIPPKKERILEQYQDAFLQATREGDSANTLRNLVSKTSPDTFTYAKEAAPKIVAVERAGIIYGMSDEAFGKLSAENLKELGLSGSSYTRESAIEELRNNVGSQSKGNIKETIEEMGKKAKETCDAFIEKAKQSFEGLGKEDELYKLSKKSAKSLNRKKFLNKGIKIGILVALLGSFVLGLIASRKANKMAQQQAAMEAQAQKQAQETGGINQITPQQTQAIDQSQMMAQAQNEIPIPPQAQHSMSQIKPLQAQDMQTPQMQIAQNQAPQMQVQQQNVQPQTEQNSAEQYFKTPMQSPLI
jgi:hypothetical protein